MRYERIYILDYYKLAAWLLPTFLRKTRIVAWLGTLFAPLIILHQDFLKYRGRVNYKLTHNSQVCYLQKVLNDAFDREQRRIRIQNGVFLQPWYIYTAPEELPSYIGTKYIYSEAELSAGQTDFVVLIPADLKPSNPIALQGLTSDIKALINEFKLASKTYIIKWIE